ncbi:MULTISPECIES: glycoside hydrolase family protein [Aurantimonas]|uniref:glycoside hydrolase family protein n=1 Tax=Aurantimonas TaxID=182269 RepID=UPI0035126B10
MDTSAKGRAFMRAHEGDVLTGYLDPVRVPTIGTGATNRSRVATAFLKAIGVPGGKIVPGKTKITKAQSDQMFAAMLSGEYEPPVDRTMAKGQRPPKQHEFDAAVSVSYNLGSGSLNWVWMKRWLAGRYADAAAYLSTHYNTAKGQKLPGLVRRRKEEAVLLRDGIYTGIGDVAPEGIPRTEEPVAPKQPDPVVKEAQEMLTERGFNPGAIDGWFGAKTKAAVLAYQRAHPHLVNDGILGPATIAQLRRDAMAAKEAIKKGGGALAGSGAAGTAATLVSGVPWQWVAYGVGAVTVAALVYVAWRYRDVIARRWNTMRGKTVEV